MIGIGDESAEDYDSQVRAVNFQTSQVSVYVGSTINLTLRLNPSNIQGKCNVRWEYDKEHIAISPDNFGALITGVRQGSGWIRATCNGISTSAIVTVNDDGSGNFSDPYIYSDWSVLEMKPGDTQTVSVSLFGGNSTDLEKFEWSIKDTGIATIEQSYARNNCVIRAQRSGSTQLVASHPDAEYDYTFVVFVSTDPFNEPYITTEQNVITINRNETSSRSVSVSLKNPPDGMADYKFHWDIDDSEDGGKGKGVISLVANGNTAVITPLKNGLARLKVTHDNAQYPLYIIVRVTTVVENVYIDLSTTTLIVTGSESPHSVFANIKNYGGVADNSEFTWTIPDDAADYMDAVAADNTLSITGKKNGKFKISVHHELSQYDRTLLVILQEQAGSMMDASMYITTDQNFVQTKVGDGPTRIHVRLVGGVDGVDNAGDENTNFSWWFPGGMNNNIVRVERQDGAVRDSLVSRNAVSSGMSCEATIDITPLNKGECTMIVTHPRCVYDLEIKIKVYGKDVLVNPKLVEVENSLIRLLNGNSVDVRASFRNGDGDEENYIKWESENTGKVSVMPAVGPKVSFTANGTGSAQTNVKVHHDDAQQGTDRKILVLTADTKAELDSMKGIYSENTYLRVSVGETKEIMVEGFGLGVDDEILWSTVGGSNATVTSVRDSANHCTAKVTGSFAGKATVTATLAGSGAPSVEFYVDVLPRGSDSDIYDENAGYLTTRKNAVVISDINASESLSVTGMNISDQDMQLWTEWKMNDLTTDTPGDVFSLSGSPGPNVVLTANKKGKSNIVVSNKKSNNKLSISAKCGELYEWLDGYVVYINCTSGDVVNILNGDSKTIYFELVNADSKELGNYDYKVLQGQDIVDITGTKSPGRLQVNGVNPGQAIIEVSNSLAGDVTKEILVNVANTEEELRSYRYLTTTQNVITVSEQQNVTATVSVANATSPVLTGFNWVSKNPDVATVTGSGSVATVYGKKAGTALIEVTNGTYCEWPLQIICNVVDPVAAEQNPYIQCANIVSVRVGSSAERITASLIGGVAGDERGFSYEVRDPSIAGVQGQNDSALITAKSEGVTQVIVNHPKASPRFVLVICEPRAMTNYVIRTSTSIMNIGPNDGEQTITAELINGTEEDKFDFVWWADSYDKIRMDYTGNVCVIKPLSAGRVNLHVKHRKAAQQRDIVLLISDFRELAFNVPNIEIPTGGSVFVPMNVPALEDELYMSYGTSNSSLCAVSGNNSVCILTPGVLPQGKDSASCVVTAQLVSKAGIPRGNKAELLVAVVRKSDTEPYIALSPNSSSTIFTMNKGERINITANIFGSNVSTDADVLRGLLAGLQWEASSQDGSFVKFIGPSTGPTVQIEAVASGKCVVTVRHRDRSVVKNPLTCYVVVAGTNEPVLSLNYSELPLYIGEDAVSLVASVQNDMGEEITWEIINDAAPDTEQDFFTFSKTGKKALILPKKTGEATIRCSIPSGSVAECKVRVMETEKVEFFVYDDEGAYKFNADTNTFEYDNRRKVYLNALSLTPGVKRAVHWETVPPKQPVKQFTITTNNVITLAPGADGVGGYVDRWHNDTENVVYHYPDGVGTVIVTGLDPKGKDNTVNLKIDISEGVNDIMSITSDFNYLFSMSKSMVTYSPDDVIKDRKLLYVDYELRPANCKLYITNPKAGGPFGENLRLVNGTVVQGTQGYWKIDRHTVTEDTAVSGIVKGTLMFEVDGEVNTDLNIAVVNEALGGTTPGGYVGQEVLSKKLKIAVYYPSHTFSVAITRHVPYYNQAAHSANEMISLGQGEINGHSFFEKSTGSFILGDGESLSGTVTCNEPLIGGPGNGVKISRVYFKPLENKNAPADFNGKRQYELVGGDSAGQTVNVHDFNLYHTKDYGDVKYFASPSATAGTVRTNFFKIAPTSLLGPMENHNTTIKTTQQAGYLCVEYANFATGSGSREFVIPVFVQVRDTPCCISSLYGRNQASGN